MTLVTTSDDTWWLWWEYNKSRYLRPNNLSLADVSCEANYTVFNEWSSAVFQTTL